MGKDQKQQMSKWGIAGIVAAIILAIVIAGIIYSGGDGRRDCPPGTVWSEDHQHCH